MQTVNQVKMTNDYGKFSFLEGNRMVNPLNKRRLSVSMVEKQIQNPIVVNEKHAIIDGQHRFTVMRENELPVYYIVVDGLELEDVHRLNTNQKNWNADDFMNGYIRLGNKEYKLYRDFKQRYGFGHKECQAMLTGRKRNNAETSELFRNGGFKVKTMSEAKRWAEQIEMVEPYYDGYKRRTFIYAMLDMFDEPIYDHAEFIQKLGYQSGKLTDQTTVEHYKILIESIFNYRRNPKVRLY